MSDKPCGCVHPSVDHMRMYNTILLGEYHPIVSLSRSALENTDFLVCWNNI